MVSPGAHTGLVPPAGWYMVTRNDLTMVQSAMSAAEYHTSLHEACHGWSAVARVVFSSGPVSYTHLAVYKRQG